MLEIDKKRLEKLDQTYQFQRVVSDGDDRVRLDDPGEQRCRFCGGKPGDSIDGDTVTFKKDAHVIPQLLGNSNLVSDFECDICNEYFSLYESSLGEYTSPIRALLGI